MQKNRFKGLWFLLLLLPLQALCQSTTKIHLVSAERLEYRKKAGEDFKRLTGHVVFEHDSAFLYCDSAWFYEENNSITAYGKIRIKMSDTLNLYGELLNYAGDTKLAELHRKVTLADNRATLTTEHLFYDRNTKVAYFFDGGKIVDKENTLTSRKGYYYTDDKEFFFREKVKLVNDRYTMNSDTLKYNTVSKTAFFFGPTTIRSKKNLIYCENGWYNTENEISRYSRNAYLESQEQTLKGDSLCYDRNNGIGRVIRNVYIVDTARKIVIRGNLGNYYEKAGYSHVTDSAVAILVRDNDSLYLHADTLRATFDSTQNIKHLYAYYKAKFYRNDLQGLSDSVAYSLTDSVIVLYRHPVLWSKEIQMTADTVAIKLKNGEVQKVDLFSQGFVISREDTLKYNQIKGRRMTGYFLKNDLKKIRVEGNSETLYYVKEEDGSELGINKGVSGDMLIYLDDRDFKSITYLEKPTATFFPPNQAPPAELILNGFKWITDKRPRNKSEIFRW